MDGGAGDDEVRPDPNIRERRQRIVDHRRDRQPRVQWTVKSTFSACMIAINRYLVD